MLFKHTWLNLRPNSLSVTKCTPVQLTVNPWEKLFRMPSLRQFTWLSRTLSLRKKTFVNLFTSLHSHYWKTDLQTPVCLSSDQQSKSQDPCGQANSLSQTSSNSWSNFQTWDSRMPKDFHSSRKQKSLNLTWKGMRTKAKSWFGTMSYWKASLTRHKWAQEVILVCCIVLTNFMGKELLESWWLA